RAEIEKFAAEFFHLSPTPRHKHWQELYDRCSWSLTLAARLKALAPGLKVDRNRPSSEGPYCRRLAHYVCDLFLLRPAERAAQRRALLEGMADDMAEWERAAKGLLLEDAIVARLEPGFVRQVVSWQAQQRALAKRRDRSRPRQKSAARSGESKWIAWVAIIVVVGLVKLIAGTSSSKNTPRAPEIHVPDVNFNKPDLQVPENNPVLDHDIRRLIEKQQGRPVTDEEWEQWRHFGAPKRHFRGPGRNDDPFDEPVEPDKAPP